MNKLYLTHRREKKKTLQNFVHLKSGTTWNAECHSRLKVNVKCITELHPNARNKKKSVPLKYMQE